MSNFHIIDDDDFEDLVPNLSHISQLGEKRDMKSNILKENRVDAIAKKRRGVEIDTGNYGINHDCGKASENSKHLGKGKENIVICVESDGFPPLKKKKNVNGKGKSVKYVDDKVYQDAPTIKQEDDVKMAGKPDGGLFIKKRRDVKAKAISTLTSTEADHCYVAPRVFKTWDFYVPKELHSTRPINVHTNESVSNVLKQCLNAELIEKFSKTCFGHFLNMPVFTVQNQLLVGLLLREVEPPSDDALWFIINGKKLRFGLQDFGLVTGLLCEGDHLKDYSSDQPNRLVMKYFNGTEKVSKTALVDCFLQKRWDSAEDAIKLAALYFIHTFLLSTKNDKVTPHIIPVEEFNLVESGEWETFPWGTRLFFLTIDSMHDKVRFIKKSYRFAGFPYALLLWFYECCPTVCGKIATRVANTTPRILNWKVTKILQFQDVQSGIFRLPRDKVLLNNIAPTDIERERYHLPKCLEYDREHGPVKNSPEVPLSPVVELPRQPRIIADQSKASVNSSDDIKILYSRQCELKSDIASINKNVGSMNKYMVVSFERILKGMHAMEKKFADYDFFKSSDQRQRDGLDHFSFEGFGSDIDIAVSVPKEVPESSNSKNAPASSNGDPTLNPENDFQIHNLLSEARKEIPTPINENDDQARHAATERDCEKGINSDSQSPLDVMTESQIHQLTCAAREEIASRGKNNNTGVAATFEDFHIANDNQTDIIPNFSLGITQLFDEPKRDSEMHIVDKQNELCYIVGSEGLQDEREGEYVDMSKCHQQHTSGHLQEQTLKKSVRTTRPAKFKRSPFINSFGDSGGSSQLEKKMNFPLKHPFLTNIWRPINKELDGKFNYWIDQKLRRRSRDEPYTNSVNVLENPFDLGVYVAEKKEWFHTLNYDDKPLTETHLDVIFYYLRKKGKYDPGITARFTTTDCYFDTMIRELHNTYLTDKNILDSASVSHVISDYMNGRFMHCNMDWRLVDDVLFPIKIVDDWHWSLGRLSLKDKAFYVYDSKLDNETYDGQVLQAMEPYKIIIPFFLSATGYYSNIVDLKTADTEFGEEPLNDPFEVYMCRDMRGVHTKNYGVLAAVLAEYFIHGRTMPSSRCDLRRHRRRYGALLWDYALKKYRQNASSDDEYN